MSPNWFCRNLYQLPLMEKCIDWRIVWRISIREDSCFYLCPNFYWTEISWSFVLDDSLISYVRFLGVEGDFDEISQMYSLRVSYLSEWFEKANIAQGKNFCLSGLASGNLWIFARSTSEKESTWYQLTKCFVQKRWSIVVDFLERWKREALLAVRKWIFIFVRSELSLNEDWFFVVLV